MTLRPNRDQLGCAVESPWHNSVHVALGGDMKQMDTAPKDPISGAGGAARVLSATANESDPRHGEPPAAAAGRSGSRRVHQPRGIVQGSDPCARTFVAGHHRDAERVRCEHAAGNDDGSTGRAGSAFPANFFGATFTGLFVNNNGNVTFQAPLARSRRSTSPSTGRRSSRRSSRTSTPVAKHKRRHLRGRNDRRSPCVRRHVARGRLLQRTTPAC